MTWNQKGFDDACRRFRAYFPDFESFDRPGDQFVRAERADTDNLVERYRVDARPLLTESAARYFSAYVEILGRQQSSVNWRFVARLRDLSEKESSRYGQILTQVVKSDASPDSITAYGRDASRLLKSLNLPPYYAEVRSLVSLLMMLHEPREFMCDSISSWNFASDLLLGEELLEKGSLVTGEEFVRCQDFAKRVSKALADAGLRPKDMIDVQGFIYTVRRIKRSA